MQTLDIVLYSLAVWRISSLLCHEDGPKAIFRKMREGLERRGFELFYQLFQCVWCTSIWVGSGLMVLWYLVPTLCRPFFIMLTASTIAIVIQTGIEEVKSE